jgi:uncharacterized protein YegL
MTTNIPTIGGEVVKRDLNFFWLVDVSGSMSGQRIAILNQAIKEVIPEIKNAVQPYPEVKILMRAIKFADNASWHIGPDAIPLESFVWSGLEPGGLTATSQAINMLSNELDANKLKRGLPPVVILISDGFCTDTEKEYDAAIQKLESLSWGKKAVRLVIAVGSDEEYDEKSLLKFVSHKEIGVLKAHSAQELVKYIKWASISASIGSSQSKGSNNQIDQNIVLPPPPKDEPQIASSTDVF